MSNVIQIKRGNSKPDGKLAPYELGVQINDGNKLFIGGALNEDGAYGDAQQIKVENAINAENASKLNNVEASSYILKSQIIGENATEKVQNSINADEAINASKANNANYANRATNATNAENANKIKNNNNEYITFAEMLNLIYPIDSIYMSFNNTNPGTLFGGIWEPLQDSFLIGAGNKYSVNNPGGKTEHTLTIDEMPSHSHNFDNMPLTFAVRDTSKDNAIDPGSSGTVGKVTYTTATAGGGDPFSIMPPYQPVFMWRRTA